MATITNEQFVAGSIFVTGSVIVTGSIISDTSSRTLPNDVYFFVSGTRSVTGSNAKVALFDGDVVISGSLVGFFSVASSASLPSNANRDGLTAFVTSNGSQWIFSSGSTMPVTESVVVTASLGRWIRTSFAHPKWTYQNTWFIHSGSGHDENDGFTSGSALKSHAELERRWGSGGVIKQTTNVWLLTSLNEILRANVKLDDGTSTSSQTRLRYIGVPSVTLYSGNFSSITNFSAGVTHTHVFNTSASFNWATSGPASSSLINKRIRKTNGTGLMTSWVARAMSTTEARCSVWFDNDAMVQNPAISLAATNPSANDSFVVEALPQVLGLDFSCSRVSIGAGTEFHHVVFDSIDFECRSDLGIIFRDHLPRPVQPYFHRCRFNNAGRSVLGGAYIINCLSDTAGLTAVPCSIIGGLFRRPASMSDPIGLLNIGGNVLFQGLSSGLALSNGSTAFTLTGISFFDCTGSCISLSSYARFSAQGSGLIWGSGSTGIPITMTGGCMFVYNTKPTVSGSATADVTIGGQNLFWSQIPYSDTAKMCGMVQQ